MADHVVASCHPSSRAAASTDDDGFKSFLASLTDKQETDRVSAFLKQLSLKRRKDGPTPAPRPIVRDVHSLYPVTSRRQRMTRKRETARMTKI